MNLRGRSREDVVRMLGTKTRGELLDIIVSLVQVEQHFTPTEIASRSGMTKRTILADIHAGKFGCEYYFGSDSGLQIERLIPCQTCQLGDMTVQSENHGP